MSPQHDTSPSMPDLGGNEFEPLAALCQEIPPQRHAEPSVKARRTLLVTLRMAARSQLAAMPQPIWPGREAKGAPPERRPVWA
jgi:hypothetical protein